MRSSYDAIVLGLGAVGSAAAYHLARRGRRVLGLDRFAPPHALGSSHGGSRIIRRAYFEGARYLPLIDRAYTLWRELEEETGEALLHVTGGLNIGPADGAVVAGARRAAEAQRLAHEVLDAEAVQSRFPAFTLPEDDVAVWEAGAGFLNPERCIAAHLAAARNLGATLGFDEPALGWKMERDSVAVTTPRATYRAARLVLAAGGGLRDLLPELPLVVERQVNAWFRPVRHAARFAPSQCPIFIWQRAGEDVFYGFPNAGAGVKVGLHHQGALVDHPDRLDRTVNAADIAALREALGRLLPDADGLPVRAAVCFYTNTPDQHYCIDRHPAEAQVVFASACSGHGFKASNAVGEALADLTMDQTPQIDLAPFRARG